MSEPKFEKPDFEADKKRLDEEERRSGTRDWSEIYWKPQPGDNLIRILPAKVGSGTKDWHIVGASHFIKHADRIEAFTCMKDTYNKPCPACERFFELVMDKETKKEADRFRVTRYGVFNIIDRSEHEPKVRLYRCPRKSVWHPVVQRVTSRGKMSNLFDEYDEKGKLVREGRDVLITYNPESDPSGMYRVQITDEEPLGTDESITKWLEEITPLIAEEIFNVIDYEIAKIKTFGSREDRDELRAQMAAEFEKESEEEGPTGKATEEKKEEEEEKEEEPSDEVAKAKKVIADAEKAKKKKEEEKPKEEEKKKEEEKPEDDSEETKKATKEKIQKIRDRAAAAKK